MSEQPADFCKYIAELEARIKKLESQPAAAEPVFGVAQNKFPTSTEVVLGWRPSKIFAYSPTCPSIIINYRDFGFVISSDRNDLGNVILYVAWR